MTNKTETTKPQENTKDILYYDSDCPICSAEMSKLCQLKNDSLTLVPIKSISQDLPKGMSATQISQLYDELHIYTNNGKWITGYDANIYAWQQTKYVKFAKMLGKPPFLWFGKLGYKMWLVCYKWRRGERS